METEERAQSILEENADIGTKGQPDQVTYTGRLSVEEFCRSLCRSTC